MLFSRVSRTTRALTGASTPSMISTGAEADLGEQGQPHAEQGRHQRAVDLEAFAEEAGEVAERRAGPARTPSGPTSRQSTRKPIEKPVTAPVMLPPSRPRRRRTPAGCRGWCEEGHAGEEGELEQHDQDRDRDQAGEDLRGDDHSRGPPGQHLHEVQVGEIGEWSQVDLLAGLLLDDRGLGHFADRDVRAGTARRGPGRASRR